MPSNNGHYRRKSRKEEALERRIKNVHTYQQGATETMDEKTVQRKLNIAERDVTALKHNITLPKRGRSW